MSTSEERSLDVVEHLSSPQTHTPAIPGSLEPGSVIDGRYELIDCIGVGGFALVYRARQMRIDSDVALKVLDLACAGVRAQELEQRFLDEARATASVRHPNVVRVHDHGRIAQSGKPYIAMELLEGHDLHMEILSRGPISPARAVWLLKPVLGALGEAHKQGIVHKDLKPDNLFLRRPGSAVESLVLTDFGVARVQSAGRKTRTGQVLGTPQYLAPEYIEDQIATPALDVYQMGLILVEAITGKPVLNSPDPLYCMLRHCDGRLDIPAWLLDSVLGPIIAKATARDMGRRYEDGHAFRQALEALDDHSLERLSARWRRKSGYTPTMIDAGVRHNKRGAWRKAGVRLSMAGLMTAMTLSAVLWQERAQARLDGDPDEAPAFKLSPSLALRSAMAEPIPMPLQQLDTGARVTEAARRALALPASLYGSMCRSLEGFQPTFPSVELPLAPTQSTGRALPSRPAPRKVRLKAAEPIARVAPEAKAPVEAAPAPLTIGRPR